jgi:hypothetical protein
MIVAIIVLTVQVLITVASFIQESGEDPRFQGDKLGYRS